MYTIFLDPEFLDLNPTNFDNFGICSKTTYFWSRQYLWSGAFSVYLIPSQHNQTKDRNYQCFQFGTPGTGNPAKLYFSLHDTDQANHFELSGKQAEFRWTEP